MISRWYVPGGVCTEEAGTRGGRGTRCGRGRRRRGETASGGRRSMARSVGWPGEEIASRPPVLYFSLGFGRRGGEEAF